MGRAKFDLRNILTEATQTSKALTHNFVTVPRKSPERAHQFSWSNARRFKRSFNRKRHPRKTGKYACKSNMAVDLRKRCPRF